MGDTPLHLFIKNVHKIEKIKPLKDLLTNGASRTLKNINGLTALEVFQDLIKAPLEESLQVRNEVLLKEIEDALSP